MLGNSSAAVSQELSYMEAVSLFAMVLAQAKFASCWLL
jgi:hypothetical protein